MDPEDIAVADIEAQLEEAIESTRGSKDFPNPASEVFLDPSVSPSALIQNLLVALAKTASIPKKKDLLKNFTTDQPRVVVDVLKRVLKYGVDKFIRFGVSCPSELQANPEGTLEIDHPSVWALFDELAHTAGSGSLGAKTSKIIDVLHTLREEAFTIAMVILDKDLGNGISEKLIVSVLPGLLATFNVQLAAKFEEKRIKTWPVAIEPKYDGMRVMCRTTAGGAVSFHTRNGNEVPAMEGFKPLALKLRAAATMVCDPALMREDIWFDGEFTAGESFNESISSGRNSEAAREGTFTVFDLVIGNLVDGSDFEIVRVGTYKERRKLLQQSVETAGAALHGALLIDISPVYWCGSVDEIQMYYARFRARKLEGAIVKLPDGLYMRKRSPNWMKLKNAETADLKIKGAFEGEGNIAGQLGGFILDRAGVDVRVGGGFTAQQRVEFWAIFQKDLEKVAAGNRDDCELIDSLCEVGYQEVTPDGSLRHPVFIRVRRDKVNVSF